MTAQQVADRIKQLAHEAHQAGNQHESEILELTAQGIEREHSDIMLRLLRGIRDAYNAGRTDQMKASQGG
jgi:hypothetical protein